MRKCHRSRPTVSGIGVLIRRRKRDCQCRGSSPSQGGGCYGCDCENGRTERHYHVSSDTGPTTAAFCNGEQTRHRVELNDEIRPSTGD